MTIDEFIERTYNVIEVFPGYEYQEVRPRIICNNGFSLSVQCSELAYSTPRQNVKKYTEVEIGYPSNAEELLLEYAEDPNVLTETVYGYVPIEIVEKIITKHGGINVEETFSPVQKKQRKDIEKEIKNINDELTDNNSDEKRSR